MGVQTNGSICFTAASAESGFVPLLISDLIVTNQNGSLPPAIPFSSRTVIVADKPLLEPWMSPSGHRMLTIYGKPNTTYEVRYSTNLNAHLPWTLGWTNTVPASLYYTGPVKGAASNAPALFLNANEK